MSAQPAEQPSAWPHAESRPKSLLEAADELMERLPGYRVEIVGGILTVTPPPDLDHADSLTLLMVPFMTAGLHTGETTTVQGIGLWLPDGPEDYAIPDLSLVEADAKEHMVGYKCYAPEVFRLVLEVTSSNYNNDLLAKVAAYAGAQVPVYVIVNRKHGRVHVLTEPEGCEYGSHRVYAPGEQVTLPDSVGAKVTFNVTDVLGGGRTAAD